MLNIQQEYLKMDLPDCILQQECVIIGKCSTCLVAEVFIWQKLFIFSVGTDKNGTYTEEIVKGNLLSSFTYLQNNSW